MTRVCFIGDSHLATLKFGLSLIDKDLGQIEPVFFGGPGKSMQALALSGDALIATNDYLNKSMKITSGGRDAIRDEYDCFALHGLELSIAIPLLMIRESRTNSSLPQWLPRDTNGAFRHAVENAVLSTNAVKIVTMLRHISAAPIFVSPAPLSSIQLPALRARLTKQQQNESLVQMFEASCTEISESMNATFIPQPVATRDADGIATKASYSQRPARFAVGQPVEDKSHMNADYGAAVLRDFFAAASLSSR